MKKIKIVVIISTGGGVLAALLKNNFAKNKIVEVVSDRDCGAIAVANTNSIPNFVLQTNDSLAFSNFLLDRYKHATIDLFVSFYTKLIKGDFLTFANNKLINLHPSLLPACPGMNGFEDTVKSRAKFIGSTIHFIDSGIDTGAPIIQAAIPFDPKLSIADNRHKIFIQQYKMLLQTIRWLEEERLQIDSDGNPFVMNASYNVDEFSPNLDDDFDSHCQT